MRRIAAACPAVSSTEVVALSHLRAVKDPLLLPQAMQQLDSRLTLTAVHLGGSLDPQLASDARAFESSSLVPRWRWLGERTRCAALRRLARARALVLTSRQEGGPSVLAEAALLGRPILATRVGGAVGMLGPEHPGLYTVGDSQGLAALLTRLATDTAWVEDMAARSRALAARFDPASEQQLWEQLLREPPPV